jgi:hypothetical protein
MAVLYALYAIRGKTIISMAKRGHNSHGANGPDTVPDPILPYS